MNARLDAPGVKPSAAELRATAAELLHQARIQLGGCKFWAEQPNRQAQLLAALQTLATQIETARRAVVESEFAR